MRGVDTCGRAGATLVEVVIVLACAGILAIGAAPNFEKLRHEWNLWVAAHMLESTLQWGRMHAISSNSAVTVQVSSDGRSYQCADANTGERIDASVRHMPSAVRITGSPRTPLRFFQRGNAAPAGTYTLQGPAGQYRVIVNIAGRIRIQRD
jgi:Tfp pilus assembly protein FimT